MENAQFVKYKYFKINSLSRNEYKIEEILSSLLYLFSFKLFQILIFNINTSSIQHNSAMFPFLSVRLYEVFSQLLNYFNWTNSPWQATATFSSPF